MLLITQMRLNRGISKNNDDIINTIDIHISKLENQSNYGGNSSSNYSQSEQVSIDST